MHNVSCGITIGHIVVVIVLTVKITIPSFFIVLRIQSVLQLYKCEIILSKDT